MQGCGNDFVVIDDRLRHKVNWKDITKAMMHRHFGIGGDGLMVIQDSDVADFSVLMFNPDGSYMGMCGNGIRCVTRFVIDNGLAHQDQKNFIFDVSGRKIECSFDAAKGLIHVNMGAASFNPQDLPINASQEVVFAPLIVEGNSYDVTCLSVGNPHCVIFVADVERVPLNHLGPLIENHELFPKRTNVEFVEIVSREHLKLRVWERGAGPTLACGTAACASLVAAVRSGRSENRAMIDLPGGRVEVSWDQERNLVFLEGPAKSVFEGQFFVDNFLS